MAQYFVKVVDDGTLGTEEGWAFGTCEDTGQLCFITERSAMTDQAKINEVWAVARTLVIEQAVRDGEVEYVKRPGGAADAMRAAVMSGHVAD